VRSLLRGGKRIEGTATCSCGWKTFWVHESKVDRHVGLLVDVLNDDEDYVNKQMSNHDMVTFPLKSTKVAEFFPLLKTSLLVSCVALGE
jgi:hypothetical protein